MELPVKFKEQMKELLQDEYEDYLQSFDHERYYGLRINSLKISVEEFLKISPFKLKPIPWTNDGFYYSSEDKPSKHPYYYAGLYYLQEPSAMLPAQVLPVDENDIVLDTCAAPGGKSTKLATKLNHTGLLISNDISSSRCQGLIKNIELFGCDNAWVTSEDLTNMEEHYPETFDKILVDAPCSGEGMFRKEPDLIKSWIEKDDTFYPPIQKNILNATVSMLKPGGSIVYSTCTFSIHENEEVIQELLKMANQIKEAKDAGNSLGLTDEEMAFYDALTKPQAIKDFYHNNELVSLTKELTETLRNSRTVDWQKKQSARARMRMIVKKLLKKYKYPPEGMEDALQTVMVQCELWTDNTPFE